MQKLVRRSAARVTIVDVAKAAGVSPATVSNAITGKKKVDEATRSRIEDAIGELGYIPNAAARGMRTGRSNAIAIYSSMPTGVAAGASKLGFLMEVAASAAVTAMETNTSLVLVPPISDPSQAVRSIAIDGALLLEPLENDPVLDATLSRGIPTVTIGAPIGRECHHVDLDYALMAELLITHLIDGGARSFPLLIGKSRRKSNIEFVKAYARHADALGMTPRILEIDEAQAEENALAAVANEIGTGPVPDAILVPIDAMATGAMGALRQAGLRVPEDVRVATRYDGVRARSEDPQLTALDLQLEEVAKVATQALSRLIEGEAVEPRIAAPKPTLIARASSRAQPGQCEP
ncbi:MAG: substrate-binding domain-containing protein [Pseudomonadota bacterium]